jgi:hypothetical protein
VVQLKGEKTSGLASYPAEQEEMPSGPGKVSESRMESDLSVVHEKQKESQSGKQKNPYTGRESSKKHLRK